MPQEKEQQEENFTTASERKTGSPLRSSEPCGEVGKGFGTECYSEVSLIRSRLVEELAPRLASSSIFASGTVCKQEIARSEGSRPGF